nr:adenosylcobinamide-GDP ribazoletransferase [Phaeobacter sp.]
MPKNDMKIIDILLSLVLLTRLPLPHLDKSDFARQAQAVWAFPFAGLAVALPAAAIGQISLSIGLPAVVSAGLMIAVLILLSGAMHEDGLADTVDGFWGGFDRGRRLDIMKDSHIGTYGVLALIIGIGLRWGALAALIPVTGVWIVIATAMLSRAMMPVLMAHMPNARHSGLSQSVGKPKPTRAYVGVGVALIGAIALLGSSAIVATGVMLVAAAAVAKLARAKIGGQTGDVLGATQQISEIAGLLCLLALYV